MPSIDFTGTVRVVIVGLIVAALAVAGCVGLGWMTATTRAENKRLSAAVAGLTVDLAEAKRLRLIDQAVATRYAGTVAKLTTTQKATDAKLRAALRANAAWSDSAVPPGVLDALGVPSPAPAP